MATSSPPPNVVPCSAMTTGFGESSMRKMNSASWAGGLSPATILLNSRMSAPAIKVFPAPITTMASTAASATAALTPAAIPSGTPGLRALTGGLSIVITAMPSWISRRTSSLTSAMVTAAPVFSILPTVTGAESLLRTLLSNGVDTCFMNPGTSEMHFVAALERVPGMRGILCLFEGVCSGAADGYARALGRPASTLLHLGPGLANGLANFHNARKARSPVVSIVGEHATRHLKVDAPLTSDVAAFARTVSDSVRTARSADDLGPAAAETIAAAWGPPGAVAMLIVPADYSWSGTEIVGPAISRRAPGMPSDHAIDRARRALREDGTAILLGGMAVSARAMEAAGRTGARVMTARNVAKIAWGRGRFPAPQVPYFPGAARLLSWRGAAKMARRPSSRWLRKPRRRRMGRPQACPARTLKI